MQSRFALVILAASISAVSGVAQDFNTSAPIVSVVQLLSSPERYDGKRVAALGFLTIGQENNVLYLGKNDYHNALPNGIWIEPSSAMVEKRNELSMKYVRLVGVFHIGHAGHRSIFVGGIGEISGCSLLSDPDHPFSEKLKGLAQRETSPKQ